MLNSRSVALRRLQDVRKSLVTGMWITEWTDVPVPKDKPEAKAAVKVTVRGWRDAMTKAEARWSSENGGKKSTAAEIVKAKVMRSAEFVSESVKIVAQKEVKECLTEFTIQMEVKPAESIASNAKDAKGRKGKAAK